MRSKQQVEEELQRQRRNKQSAADYRDGEQCVRHEYWTEALQWVLSTSPSTGTFSCPKCNGVIVKYEPASGYYTYPIDGQSGEAQVTDDNFHCRDNFSTDTWYQCGSCHWRADRVWVEWYEGQDPGDEEERSEAEESFREINKRSID